MMAQRPSLSVVDLAALTEQRSAAAEARWVQLCVAFLTDPDCNRNWTIAKEAGGSPPPTDAARLTRLLRHPDHPFRFPAPMGFNGQHRARLVYLFLRCSLFPAALETILRDAEVGLSSEARGDVVVQTAPATPLATDGLPAPEGISDEDVQYRGDWGSLQGPPVPESASDEASDEALIAVPGQRFDLLTRISVMFSELAATGRFESKRHGGELQKVHRNLRGLVDQAYPPVWSEGEATCRVYDGCTRAIELLARAGVRTHKPLVARRTLDATAMVLTGKAMELAGLSTLRADETDSRRLKRVRKALERAAAAEAGAQASGKSQPPAG
jgi:hypothetical protein